MDNTNSHGGNSESAQHVGVDVGLFDNNSMSSTSAAVAAVASNAASAAAALLDSNSQSSNAEFEKNQSEGEGLGGVSGASGNETELPQDENSVPKTQEVSLSTELPAVQEDLQDKPSEEMEH